MTTSSVVHDGQMPLCKFWCHAKCSKGNDCRFRHFFVDEGEEAHVSERRRHKEEQRQLRHDPLDPFDDKMPRSTRTLVFAEWIVQTFGAERLRQGSGVVDVAGGKGYLSYQLQCEGHHIPTTLIEPRLAKLHRKQKKALRKRKQTLAFRQICAPFEAGLWCPPSTEEEAPEEEEAPTNRATLLVEPGATTTHHDVRVEQLGPEAARAILRDCSAVVGLHADQATEPIVDFAVRHNKAFAVVPCCVFPTLFPHRRLREGQRVTTPEEFVRYLMEKDTRIRLAYLAMEGRNKVVFMIP